MRWVSHKVEAMKHVLSKFGAYTRHLATLSEDKTIRDGSKLKGFSTKCTDAKYVYFGVWTIFRCPHALRYALQGNAKR